MFANVRLFIIIDNYSRRSGSAYLVLVAVQAENRDSHFHKIQFEIDKK